MVWLVIFSIPSQRSARYVIPAMPALAMLLALPVAAVTNVLLRYAHQRYRQSELYVGEKPAIVLDGVVDAPHIIIPNDKGPDLK